MKQGLIFFTYQMTRTELLKICTIKGAEKLQTSQHDMVKLTSTFSKKDGFVFDIYASLPNGESTLVMHLSKEEMIELTWD